MTDIIVIIILVLLIGGAIAYIVRSKRNGAKCIGCPAGGNCPGGGKMPKKKLDGRVVSRKTMLISGMTCQHCASNVTNVLNQIEGVRAEVSLSAGKARIACDRYVEDDGLRNAVEKPGYRGISIS